MFKRITFTAFALTLMVIPGGTAQAAADISRPGSCSVSANWSIGLTANFNNTSGSPSTGYVDYLVMKSTAGALETASSLLEFRNAAGAEVEPFSYGWIRDTSKPGWVYRSDPVGLNTTRIRSVIFNPRSWTGAWCSSYSSRATIYSAN